MNTPVRKTQFKYKNIMRQIMDWREEYVLEYDSYPTVISMDSATRLELVRYLCAQPFTYSIKAKPECTDDYVMGMLIEESDER